MSVRKPLVLSAAGRPEELQAGDTLDAAGADSLHFSLTASADFIAGTPVYSSAAGNCDAALASASATTLVIGLAVAAATGTEPAALQAGGVLTLTTAEWDAVAGTAGGLTEGTTYYLSDSTAGRMVPTPPTTPGSFVVIVGLALDTTRLLLRVGEPVQLG